MCFMIDLTVTYNLFYCCQCIQSATSKDSKHYRCVSFGATRELAFVRAAPQENGEKVRLYFPQTNNGVFSFGRDANILWSM
jgi:hypothetical protein